MKKGLPYVISQDQKSGAWYCHRRDYPKTPVFGSIGDKDKAMQVCRTMNDSIGYGKKVGRE